MNNTNDIVHDCIVLEYMYIYIFFLKMLTPLVMLVKGQVEKTHEATRRNINRHRETKRQDSGTIRAHTVARSPRRRARTRARRHDSEAMWVGTIE